MTNKNSQHPPSHGQALPAGTQLEEFVIERVLGVGGFGITYLAKDSSLGRKVVIKENLPAQFCWRDTHALTVRTRHMEVEDADNFQYSLESFRKEASTLASLDHPGIVKVLRSFEANGTAYFVMPFVKGTALDEQIRARQERGQDFTEDELGGMLWRVLDALAHLHDRGIYHRDIKPGNILITAAGEPVLIDFGAARQRLSERSLTVIESAGYTPFEQLQTRGKVGPWSDIYALGSTLYKAMTGETPAKATDRAFDDPEMPLAERTELRARYSSQLLKSIDKAMAPKAADRLQDAGQWRDLVWKSTSHAQPEVVHEEPIVAETPILSPELPPSAQLDLARAFNNSTLPRHLAPQAFSLERKLHAAEDLPDPQFPPAKPQLPRLQAKVAAYDEKKKWFGLGLGIYPEINRGAYLTIGIILSAVSCFVKDGSLVAPLFGGYIMGTCSILFIFVWPAWIWATFVRLKSTGYETLVAAVILLPFISVFSVFYCLALPVGFKPLRKLDTVAHLMLATFLPMAVHFVIVRSSS
jgi:serine/threonine protein kinase